MPIEAAVPDTHPLMQAWAAYTGTDEARNSMAWAAKGGLNAHGSMWAAFEAGWKVAHGECADVAVLASAGEDCDDRGVTDPETGEVPCSAEKRGEVCVCVERSDLAHKIATKIRARATT